VERAAGTTNRNVVEARITFTNLSCEMRLFPGEKHAK
jgi:hypothetical protein